MSKHSRRDRIPVRITGKETIGDDTGVFTFDHKLEHGMPGQYLMVGIRDVSENPISIMGEEPLQLAVKRVSSKDERPFSHEMLKLGEGDEVSIRGPLGSGFIGHESPSYVNYLIAGGVGAAPLAYLARTLKLFRNRVGLLLGLNDKSGAKWLDYFGTDGLSDLRVTTVDGSYEKQGLVTDLIDELHHHEMCKFFICGPEPMMVAAVEKLSGVVKDENIVLSVERYMKCGEGVCGGCGIECADGGEYTTCQDGPVFTYDQLKGGDFGKRHRLKSGLKTDF